MEQLLLCATVIAFLFATPPRLAPKKRAEPEYSEAARRAQVSGSVLLSVTIGADGLVKELKVVKSLGYGLDENAAKAVRTWEFLPARDDKGSAIESTVPVECTFATK